MNKKQKLNFSSSIGKLIITFLAAIQVLFYSLLGPDFSNQGAMKKRGNLSQIIKNNFV